MGKYYNMNLWKEAVVDLKGQFLFCLKSTPMTALPWWAADIFTFISSFLSTEILAAQSIIRHITLLTYMFPVGISIATSIVVSVDIGANNARKAMREAKVASSISVLWVVVIIGSLNLFKNGILNAFNQDPAVRSVIDGVWLFVNLFIFFDILQGMFMGVIRGLALQPKVWFVSLTGYYLFGIPIASILVFAYGFHLDGIYYGQVVAIFLNFAIYGVFTMTRNW
jgi:MATE family multidrug resistance protein